MFEVYKTLLTGLLQSPVYAMTLSFMCGRSLGSYFQSSHCFFNLCCFFQGSNWWRSRTALEKVLLLGWMLLLLAVIILAASLHVQHQNTHHELIFHNISHLTGGWHGNTDTGEELFLCQ